MPGPLRPGTSPEDLLRRRAQPGARDRERSARAIDGRRPHRRVHYLGASRLTLHDDANQMMPTPTVLRAGRELSFTAMWNADLRYTHATAHASPVLFGHPKCPALTWLDMKCPA